MPKDESFLLLSLSDSKAKKIAQVVNNDSCRKILDHLSKIKSSTETKIAEDLKIPLPTAHYNLKQLVDVKLVNIDEFHYSEKGKEVNHYSLANKYIIIAPKEESGVFEKIKKLFPAFGAILLGSFIIKFIQTLQLQKSISPAPLMMAKQAESMMLSAPSDAIQASASWASSLPLWFFLGGVLALLAYAITDWLKERK
jgi:DNA-binding transcriptional ArsR family regulator